MERKTLTKEFNGEQREVDKIAWYGTIICLVVIIVGGGPFLINSYIKNNIKKTESDLINWRPGKIGRLENNFEATNRDGKLVQLKQLEDKVWVMAYQYTDDETGSIGMAAAMKELLEKFGDNPDFHLVSISANPSVDTPEKMNEWIKKYGVDTPRWWFLTAEEKVVTDYMYGEFKQLPPRITEDGKLDHDKRMKIVDGKANIRGYYEVTHPVGGPTATKFLHRDLEMILDPSKKLSDFEPIYFPKEALKK